MCFFAWKLIIGLINDELCRFWPSGARGAPEGFWGVRRTQNCQFPYGTKLSSEMLGFGPKQLVTLCFWYFRPNRGPWGQKKANLGQNTVCRKVLFPKNCHLKFCSYCTKIHVLDHISIWNIDFFGNPPKIFHDGCFCEFRPKMAKTDMWTLWWAKRVQMVLKHISHV